MGIVKHGLFSSGPGVIKIWPHNLYNMAQSKLKTAHLKIKTAPFLLKYGPVVLK